jgi:hypothetical protein
VRWVWSRLWSFRARGAADSVADLIADAARAWASRGQR